MKKLLTKILLIIGYFSFIGLICGIVLDLVLKIKDPYLDQLLQNIIDYSGVVLLCCLIIGLGGCIYDIIT